MRNLIRGVLASIAAVVFSVVSINAAATQSCNYKPLSTRVIRI